MDYSALVSAVKENDSQQVNLLLKKLRPRLISFLRIHMNASLPDAEDCVQEALINSLEIIRQDRLNDPNYADSYIISACRNTYLKLLKSRKGEIFEDIDQKYTNPSQQFRSLFKKEQNQILKKCLNQLSSKFRKFIQYWFDHPDTQAKHVANYFNISVNNAWTRKHRIIKTLNECYRKNLQK